MPRKRFEVSERQRETPETRMPRNPLQNELTFIPIGIDVLLLAELGDGDKVRIEVRRQLRGRAGFGVTDEPTLAVRVAQRPEHLIHRRELQNSRWGRRFKLLLTDAELNWRSD